MYAAYVCGFYGVAMMYRFRMIFNLQCTEANALGMCDVRYVAMAYLLRLYGVLV